MQIIPGDSGCLRASSSLGPQVFFRPVSHLAAIEGFRLRETASVSFIPTTLRLDKILIRSESYLITVAPIQMKEQVATLHQLHDLFVAFFETRE